jgi:separase
LGTVEATKVLGKDSQQLQLESGILALVGKLVALGLDALAVKEMRHLKKRLDKYLGHDTEVQRPASRSVEKRPRSSATGEKESLASLLDFGKVPSDSPALPLVMNLQTYALRIIAKLSRPRIVEACWDYLKLSNPSSPANLISHIATTTDGQSKAARQLETLAQTILSLCPHISSSSDEKPLQPSPETVLLLQQLAFKVRKSWWALVKHHANEEQELLEPFTKCMIAFARRSQISANEKYVLAKSLYEDLIMGSGVGTTANQALSSLAQAAGLSEDALLWLGTKQPSLPNSASQSKQSARLIRVATVTIEAYSKDSATGGVDDAIGNALEALKGSLSGSYSELDTLFLEVNALRRAATRMLLSLSATAQASDETPFAALAAHIIAASVHFSARIVGSSPKEGADDKAQQRCHARMTMVSKCTKSTIDSVLTCCKEIITTEEQWQELDLMLQESLHILIRIDEHLGPGANPELLDVEMVHALFVKLSNAYWAVFMQLRRAKFSTEIIVTAMQRSITVVQKKTPLVRVGSHLVVKLEQLGDFLDSLNNAQRSRKAYTQCIQAYMESDVCQVLSECAASKPLYEIFDAEGPLGTFARVLKSHHHSFMKSGFSNGEELAFFDDIELEPGVRGALLEWQLTLYLRTLSKNRHWDASLNRSITTTVGRLRELYTQKEYPIRRLRLLITLLQLSHNHADILPMQFLQSEVEELSLSGVTNTEDAGLARFGPHLRALCSLKIALQEVQLKVSTFKECFSTWETFIRNAKTWKSVTDCIDNPEIWVADVMASVEYLNAKGEEYLALPVLNLLVKIGELQKNADASELVTSQCALGIQFLRLGYTGKAGLSLAKAETLIARNGVSIEAKLRWHLAYAEYLARLGNSAKGSVVLAPTLTVH